MSPISRHVGYLGVEIHDRAHRARVEADLAAVAGVLNDLEIRILELSSSGPSFIRNGEGALAPGLESMARDIRAIGTRVSAMSLALRHPPEAP